MEEIEKCVCGGEPYHDGEWVACVECGREGEVFTFGDPNAHENAIRSWNHDMRGLRLLREVAEIWGEHGWPTADKMDEVRAWAKEETDGND